MFHQLHPGSNYLLQSIFFGFNGFHIQEGRHSPAIFVISFQQTRSVVYDCAGWKNEQSMTPVEVQHRNVAFIFFGVKNYLAFRTFVIILQLLKTPYRFLTII